MDSSRLGLSKKLSLLMCIHICRARLVNQEWLSILADTPSFSQNAYFWKHAHIANKTALASLRLACRKRSNFRPRLQKDSLILSSLHRYLKVKFGLECPVKPLVKLLLEVCMKNLRSWTWVCNTRSNLWEAATWVLLWSI